METGSAEGREEGCGPGVPLPDSWSSPRGSGGKLKMKHLVFKPRDVTLDKKGLGSLPRGNGRVPGVGEPNKLLLPTPPRQPERAPGRPQEPWSASAPLWPWWQQWSGKSGGRGPQIGLSTGREAGVVENIGNGLVTLLETSKTFKHQ